MILGAEVAQLVEHCTENAGVGSSSLPLGTSPHLFSQPQEERDMEAKELLRDQFKTMHGFMDMTVADCTPEVLDKTEDQWTINKIGTLYAHVVLGEDMMVGGMGKGGETVFNDDWKEKLGVSSVAARQSEELASMTIDLDVFREYAKAVGTATDEFLASATDEQLEKEIDGPVGKQPYITFLANIGLTHVAGHWGEIAALKGVQGLKGLPF